MTESPIITMSSEAATYNPLQISRMRTGIEEICSIQARTCLPNTIKITMTIDGTSVAISNSSARTCRDTKFAPGAELPVLVGLSDLRRNAGGVYGARDAILSEGLTLTMRNPFLSPFVVLVPGDSWDAVARRRPAIHGPAGGMACWHPAMRRPPKTRRCAATGWWKRLPDARLRF